MELHAWFVQLLIQVPFWFLIFSAVATFSFFFVRPKLWCNCEICHAYVTSSWSGQFDNLCDWYSHLVNNSPTQTIHIHVLANTITANPRNVEHVLRANFHNYPKGKQFSAILGDLLGRGIFNVDGDSWRFQMKLASSELARSSVRSHAFDLVKNEIESRLIPLLASVTDGPDSIIDLQDVFRRFSFDTICKFSFGVDPMCLELSLPISEFAAAFDLATRVSAERAMAVSPAVWRVKRFLNLGSERKLREAIKLINVLATEVIRKKRDTGSSTHEDLLSRFMRSVNDESFLRDVLVSFLLAGRDTVASALTSLFRLLADHPRVVSAIRAEADRVVGDVAATVEELRELHYLQAVVQEAMRLYPPVQFDSKFCRRDDLLPDGTFVKRGTRVTYHPYAMGRVEEIWGRDCLEFKPERWLSKDGVFVPENPYKYPVYQAGIRVCLGKEMSVIEIKSVTLAVVRGFRIELAKPKRGAPRFSPGLTATFNGGLPVFVRQIINGPQPSS